MLTIYAITKHTSSFSTINASFYKTFRELFNVLLLLLVFPPKKKKSGHKHVRVVKKRFKSTLKIYVYEIIYVCQVHKFCFKAVQKHVYICKIVSFLCLNCLRKE